MCGSSTSGQTGNGSRVGAYAVRETDPDAPLLADCEETLLRVIALRWIGQWVPPTPASATSLREALLAERWEDAVVEWLELTGEAISIYPYGIQVHDRTDYPCYEFGLRIQTTPLFRG